MKKRIVAEITRNWKGKDADLKEPLLSQRFEKIIVVNAKRGFVLESWKFQATQGEWLTESIVAVFVEV